MSLILVHIKYDGDSDAQQIMSIHAKSNPRQKHIKDQAIGSLKLLSHIQKIIYHFEVSKLC